MVSVSDDEFARADAFVHQVYPVVLAHSADSLCNGAYRHRVNVHYRR